MAYFSDLLLSISIFLCLLLSANLHNKPEKTLRYKNYRYKLRQVADDIASAVIFQVLI